jgi:23S rRNA pseudouridine1911/1915/1917 synthase
LTDTAQALIIHRDVWLLVVEKPAGLVVHPAPGVHDPTLVDQLGDQLGGGEDAERPGIVHRLDRDTSGLLVVARTPQAHRDLAEQVRTRQVERNYTALVEGRLESRTGTIDAPLGRDHRSPERVSLGGRSPREARTHFEVAELLEQDTLAQVRLETGRTHQIRVHFEAIGHPVCGDPTYGSAGRHGLTRQFLHASGLRFRHPGDGKAVAFESELPDDLTQALALARAA